LTNTNPDDTDTDIQGLFFTFKLIAWIVGSPFFFMISEVIFYKLIQRGAPDIGEYLKFHQDLYKKNLTPQAVAVVTEREAGIAGHSESSTTPLLDHGDPTGDASLPQYSVSPTASVSSCMAMLTKILE
jgi:hypothetical protein